MYGSLLHFSAMKAVNWNKASIASESSAERASSKHV